MLLTKFLNPKKINKNPLKFKIMYKNPSKQKVQDNATLIGGAVLGGMASRIVMEKIHTNTGAKNENYYEIGKRLAIAAISGYVASGIEAKDTATNFVKGSLLGMAVVQGVEAVSTALKTNNATKAAVEKSALLRAATGLNCPTYPALNVPAYFSAFDNRPSTNPNILEAAIEEASFAVN